MTNESIDAATLFEQTQLFKISDFKNENFKIDGTNTDSVLILSPSFSSVLPAEERAMLSKMLNALKLNIENVALCAAAKPPPFHFLKNKIAFTKLLVFGIEPQSIGMNINAEVNRVINFRNTKIVFSETLSTLIGNEKSKGMLWKALKEMFEIN